MRRLYKQEKIGLTINEAKENLLPTVQKSKSDRVEEDYLYLSRTVSFPYRQEYDNKKVIKSSGTLMMGNEETSLFDRVVPCPQTSSWTGLDESHTEQSNGRN